MKIILALLILVSTVTASPTEVSLIREGDLVFQTSLSDLSPAIQLATHSPMSHVGIVLKHNDTLKVFEAGSAVRFTDIERFLNRGVGQRFVVKRLRNAAVLTDSALARMRAVAQELTGKSYDFQFKWSDSQLYCSELVYKVYERGIGKTIGTQQPLKTFDLSHPLVAVKVKELLGPNPDMEEVCISPVSMFNDTSLIEVLRRWDTTSVSSNK